MAAESRSLVDGHAFLSYVREDSAQVDRLHQALQDAGIPVWRDTSDLWPGEDWRKKIRKAITDNALAFIACFSSRSLAREKSYHNEELVLAIEQLRLRRPDDPWLIPVRFDDCHIPDLDLGAGRTLTSIQRADLFGDGRDVGTERLVAAIGRILGPAGAAAPQHSDEQRRQAGDPRLSALIRNRLQYAHWRSLLIINPVSAPTPTLNRQAQRHHLEPGEEFIAIWRLGAVMPWGSSDSLAFTTSKISIADDKGTARIPYSRFGELEFKSDRIAKMVGSSPAFSCWITIEGADLQWRSPIFILVHRDKECRQIAELLNEIKQFLVNQNGGILG
jgi:TIR domain